jgi:hypothetical protein
VGAASTPGVGAGTSAGGAGHQRRTAGQQERHGDQAKQGETMLGHAIFLKLRLPAALRLAAASKARRLSSRQEKTATRPARKAGATTAQWSNLGISSQVSVKPA